MKMLLLTMLLGLALGESYETLRPGCLVERIGEVVPVRTSVILVVRMDLLSDVHEKVAHQLDNLNEIISQLPKLNLTDIQNITVNAKVSQIKNLFFPVMGPPARTRYKRGLFDFGGHLAKLLFGLAMDSETKQGFAQLRSGQFNNSLLIERGLEETHTLHLALDSVINVTNAVVDGLQALNDRVDNAMTFTLITTDLVWVYNEVEIMTRLYADFLAAIVATSHGTVSPALLPLHTLRSVLIEARVTHNLIPIIDTELVLYYPFLRGSLYSDCLTISIPFRPNHVFEAFRIHAFPFAVDSLLSVLEAPSDILMIAEEKDVYSMMDEADFRNCNGGVSGLSVCMDMSFAEHSIHPTSCVRSLLLSLDITKTCQYKEIKLTLPFVKTIKHNHYLFFENQTRATVICNGVKSQFTVHGSYVLPVTCSFNSLTMNIESVRSLQQEYTPYVPHLTAVTPRLPHNTTLALPRKLERIPATRKQVLMFGASVTSGLSLFAAVTVFFLLISTIVFFLYVRHRRAKLAVTRGRAPLPASLTATSDTVPAPTPTPTFTPVTLYPSLHP